MTGVGSTGSAKVALILVSHSSGLAEGVAELAAQMAPEVTLLPAGGNGAGGLGTSFDLVSEAISTATADGRAAVVLTDLGSAVLTTESVLDFADEDVVARVRVADAPFVEGAVAAAVTANGGADLDAVLAAATGAGSTFAGSTPAAPAAAAAVEEGGVSTEPAGAIVRTVTLRNPLGLHARPAALLARLVAGYDAQVTVDGVNAASVLELMQLGSTGGAELRVVASGPQAAEAMSAVVEAVEGGLGE